jgi:hypothetical protein
VGLSSFLPEERSAFGTVFPQTVAKGEVFSGCLSSLVFSNQLGLGKDVTLYCLLQIAFCGFRF